MPLQEPLREARPETTPGSLVFEQVMTLCGFDGMPIGPTSHPEP
jgi:hypothetical protein